MSIRERIGAYVARARALPEGALTLHDVGELIRRAGLAAGFVVESEFKCRVLAPGGNRRKIDWVWFARDDRAQPLVAFEVEGCDVDRDRLEEADRAKFTDCAALVSVLALFQVDHDLTPKAAAPGGENPVIRARRLLGLPQVQVFLDAQLMAPGGIESIQEAARLALEARTRSGR